MKKILFCTFIILTCCVRSQVCNPVAITSGPNALGTGGATETYRQSCLSYNSDLNAILWIHRSSPKWHFPGYNTGSVQATWVDVGSGAKDSAIVYYDSAGTAPSNVARFPGGVFYNPSGNTSISNAYVVSSGPCLVNGSSTFNGEWHATRKLTGTSADQQMPGLDVDHALSPSLNFGSSMFINYDMQQVGTKVFVAGEAKDLTSPSTTGFINTRGGIIGKCDFSTGNPVWSYDSIIPSFYSGINTGYATDASGGRIAFDPTGTIGYWVAQGRLSTNFNNSADSMIAPIVYKTTNGGNSWVPVLQGYDWSAKHPELKKNVGFVYNPNGLRHFRINPKHGIDLTVDVNGTLHLVGSMTGIYQDGSQIDSLGYTYVYDYDYINHHPVIWDLMTDGTTWNTMMVDSIITSYMGSDATNDTAAAYNVWTNGSTGYLSYGARIQVSRSSTGDKIFYSWADSDPAVTGNPFNTSPDLFTKSYDISGQKVTATSNLTNGLGICYFHYMADLSYFDSTSGKWISPMIYTEGTVTSGPGVYSGISAVNYNFVNCGSFTNAQYSNAAVVNTAATCTATVTFVMHQDSLNPQPGVWEISSYYSPQVTSAVWHWGDGTSTAGLAPAHTYAGPGQYTICVTVYASCGDSSTVCQNDSLYRMNQNSVPNSVVSVTVLNENGNGNTTSIKNSTKQTDQISIYPNPGTGLFALQLNDLSSSITAAEINITSILGELVYNSHERVINNSMSKEIDLRTISNGTYFMRIIAGDKTYSVKLILAK